MLRPSDIRDKVFDLFERGQEWNAMSVSMGIVTSLLFTTGLGLILLASGGSQASKLSQAIGQLTDTKSQLDDLNVSGDSVFVGAITANSDLAVEGGVSIGGDLTIAGETTIENELTVDGLTVNSDAKLASNLEVDGTTTLQDSLEVGGGTTLLDSLNVSGAVQLQDSLDVAGRVVLRDTLDIASSATFNGVFTARGAASLSDTLDVTGATVLGNTLGVSGATALDDTLLVRSKVTLDSILDVLGATTLNSTLGVEGITTLQDNLDVKGLATLQDDLTVVGISTLSSTLTVAGATTLADELVVNGATTLNGDLEVATSVVGAIQPATLLSGTLTVTGNTLITNTALGATALEVEGTTTLSGALLVTGTSNFDGTFTVGSVGSPQATVLNGTLTVDDITTLNGDLTVSGITTLNDELIFSATSQVKCDTDPGVGQTLVDGFCTLIVNGEVTLSNTLTTSGTVTVNNTLEAEIVNITSTLEVANNTTIGDLQVKNSVLGFINSGNIVAEGNLTLNDGGYVDAAGNIATHGHFSVHYSYNNADFRNGRTITDTGDAHITDDSAESSPFSTCKSNQHIRIHTIHGGIITEANCATDSVPGADYYDLAENFPSSENLVAGDVVAIDPNNPEHVIRSNGSNSQLLIGVVSTAPGITLGQSGPGYPVALAGRVPVKVTNEGGAILPGDYLTSSSTPGHAMKAAPGDKTIGQAMAGFSGSTGTVIMFVNTSGGNIDTQEFVQGTQSPTGGSANFASLNVSGQTTLAELNVTGTASIATLNVTGVATVATLQINGHIVGNDDTRGTVKITKDSQTVHHDFATPYAKVPVIVASPVDEAVAFTVKPALTGFDIKLTAPAAADITFGYLVQE